MKKVLLRGASMMFLFGLVATGVKAQSQSSGTDISKQDMTTEQLNRISSERMASQVGVTGEVRSKEHFASEAEKQAWIAAHPEEQKAENAVSVPANAQKASTALVGAPAAQSSMKTRVNNTSKALPANYKPAVEETKTADK